MRENEEKPATVHFAVMAAVAKSKRDFLNNVKREAGVILGRHVHTEEIKEAFMEAGVDLAISLAGTIRSRAQSVCPSSRTDRDIDLQVIKAKVEQLEMTQMAQHRMIVEERMNRRSVMETSGESVPVHVVEPSGSGLSFHEQRDELTSPDEPSMNNCHQKVSSTSTTTIPRHRVFPSPASVFGTCSTQSWSEAWSTERERMDSQKTTEGDGKVDRHITRNHASSFSQSAIHRPSFQEGPSSSNSFRSSSGLPFSAPSMRQSPSYNESSFMNPGPVSMSAVPTQSRSQLSLSTQPPPVATSPVPDYRLASIKDRYPLPARRYAENFPIFIACIFPNGFYTVPVDDSVANQIKTEIASWLESASDSLQEVSEEELVDGLPVLFVGKGEKQRAIVMKPQDGERTKIRCVDTGASHFARPHELRHIAAALVTNFPAQAQRCTLNIADYYKDAQWPSKVLSVLGKGVQAKNKYTCVHFFYYEDENSDEWATVDILGACGSFTDFFLRCIEK